MKKYRLLIVIITAILFVSCSSNVTAPVSTGEESEQTERSDGIDLSGMLTEDLDGNEVDSSVFEDKKLTMINVWATYCPPCRAEMPSLGKLASAYGDDFQIVGIVTDITDRSFKPVASGVSSAKDIVNETGANYPHLIPSENLNASLLDRVQYVPTTVFVDSSGKQVGEILIGSRSEAEWAAVIEKLLESLK